MLLNVSYLLRLQIAAANAQGPHVPRFASLPRKKVKRLRIEAIDSSCRLKTLKNVC